MVKQGQIVTDHFAHIPEANCTYGEGETYQHMYMKHQLTRWWPGVKLEVPGVVPNRRADAVLPLGSGVSVIECQASPISVDEWEGRTADYETAGVPLLWLWYFTLITEHHPPKEWRFRAAMLRDAQRRNGNLIVFRFPGFLEYWNLRVPYRETTYVRRVTRKVLAEETDVLPLPAAWVQNGNHTLWINYADAPRTTVEAVEDEPEKVLRVPPQTFRGTSLYVCSCGAWALPFIRHVCGQLPPAHPVDVLACPECGDVRHMAAGRANGRRCWGCDYEWVP